MANPNNPFGFRPIVRLGGSPYALQEYGKPAADSNAIFAFDLVGYLTGSPLALPENPTYNLPRVQSGSQLTPGTSLWLGSSLSYGAASTGTVHPVADETDVIFIAQCDGSTSITTSSHAHKNANVSLSQAGSTTTKQSGMQVSSSSIATTSTLDLRINRIAMISPNQEGANAIVEVLINKHALGQATAGV